MAVWYKIFQITTKIMKFNNVENECVTTTDGRQIWVSRSVAVVGVVCVVKDNVPYFLISQRGEGAADNHGLWCLPCGYLDFSETTYDAVRRELWEETGINIKEILDNDIHMLYTNPYVPYIVVSDPGENRQNVSITHVFLLVPKEKNYDLPQPNIVNHVQDNEVADVKWI